MHADSELPHLASPVDDDSEILSHTHAIQLAKSQAPLRLTRLRKLEPEIAYALVGHRGNELSLPAVHQVSPGVGGILATYKGRLNLDGLMILESVPLAHKLWSQDSTHRHDLSVDVATALDQWPLFVERQGNLSHLKPEERRALGDKWRAYRSRRDELTNGVLEDIKSKTGLTLTIRETTTAPSIASIITDAEKRFGSTWLITHVALPPSRMKWFYIDDNTCQCVGPVIWEQMPHDQGRPYFCWPESQGAESFTDYWEVALLGARNGMPIKNVEIGPPKVNPDLCRYLVAGLSCMIAAEKSAYCIRESLSLRDYMPDEDFISYACQHLERIDDLRHMACQLAANLSVHPTAASLKGREWGIDLLEGWLDRYESDFSTDEKRHVRKWIRRLSKVPLH